MRESQLAGAAEFDCPDKADLSRSLGVSFGEDGDHGNEDDSDKLKLAGRTLSTRSRIFPQGEVHPKPHVVMEGEPLRDEGPLLEQACCGTVALCPAGLHSDCSLDFSRIASMARSNFSSRASPELSCTSSISPIISFIKFVGASFRLRFPLCG